MSFEDLQKKWGGQFPAGLPMIDAAAEAGLLELIQKRERGFRRLMILGITRDLLFFLLALGTLVLVVRHGLPFPKDISREYRPFALAGVGGVLLLTIAAARGRLWLAPSAAENPSALPNRILRDGGRFDALVLWRDCREVLAGAIVIFLAVFQAVTLPAHQYGWLLWIGAGLFALSIVSFLVYRHRSKMFRPQWNGTVLSMLTLSIHQTRRQVQLLENLWWYVVPLYLGLLLLRPVRMILVRGRVRGPDLINLAVSAAVVGGIWGFNLWIARRRLRPRLEQLEKLRSDLLPKPDPQ